MYAINIHYSGNRLGIYFHEFIYCEKMTQVIRDFTVHLKNNVSYVIVVLCFSIYGIDQCGL